MPTQPELTDELRRAHFSEMGHNGAASRRARKAAVERIVRETRKAQGLPRTVTDLEVLERVAALIGGTDEAA
jgi:hypothetical protein